MLEGSQEDGGPERPILKCHKFWRASHLANSCTQKIKINEAQVIEEVKCAEEKEEYDQDYEISDNTPEEYHPIEKFKAFFEVTEGHTHLPQYSEDC
ncbi:hypothetical protein O181_000545 [Austropuccinia psidii MF-1]|uniref:Uncharacterized protein n=1 Tax=Austropuccinia psidii MF-1 TaxID=1389203 RepID=A0A9Q3B982_9BASI|nr:hypothetical protein [Austropuccinia psidii MF-1]